MHFSEIPWKYLTTRSLLKMPYLQDPCQQCIRRKDLAGILQEIIFIAGSFEEFNN